VAAAREPADADPGRAELYLRLQVEAELRRGVRMPRCQRSRRREAAEATSIDIGLQRVSELAAALTTIGAISEGTETQVLEDFKTALAIRGLTDPHQVLRRLPSWTHALAPGAQPGVPVPVRAGPPRAIPLEVVADLEVEGQPARLHIGALIACGNSAMLTVRMRSEARSMPQGTARMRLQMRALHTLAATDSAGSSYRVHVLGGGRNGDKDWPATVHVSPAPPAAARWLDLSLPGAAAPVRIPLSPSRPALAVSSRSLDPADAADRYLDICTVEQLQSIRPGDEVSGDWPGLVALATGLLEAGVLTVRSPSLARLAAAADRLGCRLPDPLSGATPEAVPADWLNLLTRAACADGPSGRILVASALPVVDGARCAITELESEPESFALRVHAWGWPEPHRSAWGRAEIFQWTARDDIGGWYSSEDLGWSHHGGEAEMNLVLRPAIDPRARELQIILTGRAAEARVTVPLTWQPVQRDGGLP
jgi:hypothetical protein